MDITVEPSILRWAREKYGITPEVLSLKLKTVPVDVITSWESGAQKLTLAQLKKLAEIYKRPLAVFFLDSPPEERENPPDRRTFGSSPPQPLSPAFNLVIRRARRVQGLAAELSGELGTGQRFKYGRFGLDTDVVAVAEKIRGEFKLSLDAQAKFSKPGELFNELRTRIEEAGVITMKTTRHNQFPIQEARAFSLVDHEPFVILVNGGDTDAAQVFSLMHEFAHVLIREAGVCNNFGYASMSAGHVKRVEAFCNRFAASFLVPGDALREHVDATVIHKLTDEELEATLRSLSDRFKVSRHALLIRLLSLSLISRDAYSRQLETWERSKPEKVKKRGGKSDPPKSAITGNGRAFASLVVEAYHQRRLPYAGVADYLDIKFKHVPRLEKLLQGNA